jgi:hypothetical protein
MGNEQQIYNLWNTFKGHKNPLGKPRKSWWFCDCLDKDIKKTIRGACTDFGGPERVLQGIVNFHLIWYDKAYVWSRTWPLETLLTITKPYNRKVRQFRRFLPGNFIAEDYLTKQEVNRRKTAQARQISDALKANSVKLNMKKVDDHIPKRKTSQQLYAEYDELKLAEMWDKDAFSRSLITKHRPEFAKKMRKLQFQKQKEST